MIHQDSLSPGDRWFDDPDVLLNEATRVEQEQGPMPDIPGYEVLCELNRGGQGVVYRAKQRSTDRLVAIKVLLDDANPDARARFEREVDLASRLQHEGIVRLYDCGQTHSGRLYIVMEYAEGVSLDECLRPPDEQASTDSDPAQYPPSWTIQKTLKVFSRICAAVQYAHQCGVIHRDLKPSNIRLDGDVPRVLDFGLARARDVTGPFSLTKSDRFVGSLPWASPEQVRGDGGAVDIRSDVYALGVILYQMLTGALPYGRTTSLARTVANIQTQAPAPLRRLRPGVPGDVQNIVLRCLAKDPQRRYQSADALLEDVERFLTGQPIAARRDSSMYVLQCLVRRHRIATTCVAVLAASIVGFGVTMTVLYKRALAAEQLAQERLLSAEREHERGRAVTEFLTTMLGAANPEVSPTDVSTIPQLLATSSRRAGHSFRDQPELEAAVRSVIGAALNGQGQPEAAEVELRRAMALDESIAEESPDAVSIEIRTSLASVLMRRGAYDDARPLLESAVEDSMTLHGSTHHQTATCMYSAGLMLNGLGYIDEAQAWFDRALQVYIASRGMRHLDTARCMQAAAQIRVRKREFSTGRAGLARALQVARDAVPGAHPAQVSILLDLCQVARMSGDAELAAEYLAEADRIQQDLGRGAHPSQARVLRQRAMLHRAQGRPLEACDDYEAGIALLTDRGGYGSDHRLASYYSGLGFAHRDINHLDQARAAFETALQLWTGSCGADHYLVGQARSNLADTVQLLSGDFTPHESRQDLP